MVAGYAGRTTAQKLGVAEGTRLALIDAPDGWTLEGLPEGVHPRRDLRGTRDVTVVFLRSRQVLLRHAARYDRSVTGAGALWLAWPRRAAGHESDVTENLLRETLLPRGLVDVKVAALDEDWSGLKFVRRRDRRPT